MMASTVTPSGQTVSQIVLPQIREAYATGSMEPLAAGLSQKALPAGVRAVK